MLALAGGLFSTSLLITLAAMLGVATSAHFSSGPQTAWEWSFVVIYATIVGLKVVPASFNLWRTFLWSGRTVFRPRGTQAAQLMMAAIATSAWMAALIVFARRFAGPVLDFLESTGFSISL